MDEHAPPTTQGTPADDLVDIPLIDIGDGRAPALVDAEPARFQAIIDQGRDHYGDIALVFGDRLSRRWLVKGNNPYTAEVDAIAERAGRAGAHLLNMSYEWTCTTGAGPDPAGEGCRMLRTLDWPLNGLGRSVVVAHRMGDAGDYFDITWPGFVGVATAMAPGRFAAALNQPPMRRWTPSCWLDWPINRLRMWKRSAIPPPHLLRQVFDTCRTFADARTLLAETPLAIPAFFTLSGTTPDEACVIERQEDQVAIHDGPAAIANHWLAFSTPGRDRGSDSRGRLHQMRELRDGTRGNFDWVTPPILNETTRLGVETNAATGALKVIGYEADGPATRVFSLS